MIIVTGATGELGTQVVRTLRQVGAEVRCLVRKGSPYFWLNDTGASYFFGDLRDPASLERACQGARLLVVCSGIRTEGYHSRHSQVTHRGHVALWEAAKRAGVERVVLVSCLGVGRSYASVAYDCRDQAEQALMQSGLEFVILHPSLFAESFASMARFAARRGWVPIFGPGENLVSPIGVSDLALMTMAGLDRAGVRNRIVELGGSDSLSYREALQQALELAGSPLARIVQVPRLGLAGGLPALKRLNRRWANRAREQELQASVDLSVPLQQTVDALGIRPASLRVALRTALTNEPRPEDVETLYPHIQHRAPKATVYQPGAMPLSELPPSP